MTDVATLRRHVEAGPYDPRAYHDLCLALCGAGRLADAADLARRWVAADPVSPRARHLLAACTGDAVPDRCPDRYVAQEFDEFASSYDTVLGLLRYAVPRLVADALLAELPGRPWPDVLDLGCGTGLCGWLLRRHAGRLVGVDLSAGMLRVAGGRGVYDELHHGEATAFLADHPGAFDAVVAGDVLTYFGDLGGVAGAAARALRPGGCLVASAERLADGGTEYRLNPTGRYSHAAAHLERVAAAAGLAVRSVAAHVLRYEAGEAVAGLVLRADRPEGGMREGGASRDRQGAD